jgi:hypothetical protein
MTVGTGNQGISNLSEDISHHNDEDKQQNPSFDAGDSFSSDVNDNANASTISKASETVPAQVDNTQNYMPEEDQSIGDD